MAEAEIDEMGTGYLTCTFRDKNGAAAQPSSADYAVHDGDTGNQIRAVTALTVTAGVVEIQLNKVDNTLVDTAKSVEIRRVTVRGIYGAADEVNKEYRYRLNNLSKVPLS